MAEDTTRLEKWVRLDRSFSFYPTGDYEGICSGCQAKVRVHFDFRGKSKVQPKYKLPKCPNCGVLLERGEKDLSRRTFRGRLRIG